MLKITKKIYTSFLEINTDNYFEKKTKKIVDMKKVLEHP